MSSKVDVSLEYLVRALVSIDGLMNEITDLYQTSKQRKIKTWINTMTIYQKDFSFSCYPLPTGIVLISYSCSSTYHTQTSTSVCVQFEVDSLLAKLTKLGRKGKNAVLTIDYDKERLTFSNSHGKANIGFVSTKEEEYSNREKLDINVRFSSKQFKRLCRHLGNTVTSNKYFIDIRLLETEVEFTVVKGDVDEKLVHDPDNEHPSVENRLSVDSGIEYSKLDLPPARFTGQLLLAVMNAMAKFAEEAGEEMPVQLQFSSTVHPWPYGWTVDKKWTTWISPVNETD